jgi:hypothetical protein
MGGFELIREFNNKIIIIAQTANNKRSRRCHSSRLFWLYFKTHQQNRITYINAETF